MPRGPEPAAGMGVLFYPRGGSAQVVRYLSVALERAGWPTELASGSLGPEGRSTNASTFYGREVLAADFTEAQRWFERGDDPMAAPLPFHPSFEDRSDVPDRVFSRVSPELGQKQIDAWSRVLDDDRWLSARVHHLHHLTPLQLAMRDRWPERRFVSHLHGTDLKFLDRVRSGEDDGPYGGWWAAQLGEVARGSAHLVCLSEQDRSLAHDLLGVGDDQVTILPNGVDTELFDRQPLSAEERRRHWRNWLVDHPQGWDQSGRPGTVNYRENDLGVFVQPDGSAAPVLMFVGRFLDFKRVPLLVRAYARARPHFEVPAPLVIWGGSPGEWEGEHPHRVALDEDVDDSVFFVGWRGHDELPLGLACADVMVAPSTDEPFGQVFLEAMAAGLPVVATATGGPLAFVNTDADAPNGWLIPADDVDALAAVLVECVNNEDDRRRRAGYAYEQIRREFAWSTIAKRFIAVYEQVIERG